MRSSFHGEFLADLSISSKILKKNCSLIEQDTSEPCGYILWAHCLYDCFVKTDHLQPGFEIECVSSAPNGYIDVNKYSIV